MGRLDTPQSSNLTDWLGWTIVIAVTGATAFWPALDGEFLNWDDDRNFVSNTSYRGVGPAQWQWAWTTDHLGVWQPLAWMLLGLEHEFAGTDGAGIPQAGVYHAVNLGCHIANGWLLFGLLASLLARANQTARASRAQIMAAGAAATLFTVHPLRVEVVAWLSAQPYLPSIGFSYLSIWCYLARFDERGEARRGSLRRLLLSFFLFAIACGFKPVALTTPLILLIVDIYPLRRHRVGPALVGKRLGLMAIEKIPFFALAAVVAYLATWAKEIGQGPELSGLLTLDQRLAQTAWSICFFLYKSIVPTDLSPFYELPRTFGLFTWPFVLCVILVLFASIVCITLRRRAPYLWVAWLSYIVVLLPNSGIVQISQQLAADRYSYFSLLGPTALLAGLIAWRLQQGTAASNEASAGHRVSLVRMWLVFMVALAACLVLTRRLSSQWQDSRTLWTYAVELDPESPHAHCELGQTLIAEYELEQAKVHLQQAIELAPDFAFAYSNLAVIQLEQGAFDRAIDHFNEALRYGINFSDADLAKIHFGLAVAHFQRDETRNGLFHAKEASRLGFDKDKIAKLMASF